MAEAPIPRSVKVESLLNTALEFCNYDDGKSSQLKLLMRTSNDDAHGDDGEDVNMEQLWGNQGLASNDFLDEFLGDIDGSKTKKSYIDDATTIVTKETTSNNFGGYSRKCEVTNAIRKHPLFERLVRAHYSCRRMIGSEDQKRQIDAQLLKVISNLSQDDCPIANFEELKQMWESYGLQNNDVDLMLEEYCGAIEMFQNQMQEPYLKAQNAVKELMTKLSSITAFSSDPSKTFLEELQNNGIFDNLSPEKKCIILREHFKRRYPDSILEIKDDFMGIKKTKKLPEDAIEELKVWWHNNILWPYPTDQEKDMFMKRTGLDGTQISNWFINQRKRHWHKFFPEGLPQCQREAKDYIERYNLLPTLHGSST